jgi:hypothetical protein
MLKTMIKTLGIIIIISLFGMNNVFAQEPGDEPYGESDCTPGNPCPGSNTPPPSMEPSTDDPSSDGTEINTPPPSTENPPPKETEDASKLKNENSPNPNGGPVVVKKTVVKVERPPHLKIFAGNFNVRFSLDKEGVTGGAGLSLYAWFNYYLGVEAGFFGVTGMRVDNSQYDDKSGGGGNLSLIYFPFKYKPENYSYYLKAGFLYEKVDYEIDKVLGIEERAKYFGVEVGGGFMFTLGSTLSVGIEATFAGAKTSDEILGVETSNGFGSFDKTSFILKFYLMVRFDFIEMAQRRDGSWGSPEKE